MPHFHRKPVVVPTDYSPSSLRAVRVARSMAKSDADVTVVHVAPNYNLTVPDHAWISDSASESDEQLERERLKRWIDHNDLGRVASEIRLGDPGTEVCKLAEEIGCQLVIVPSHGHHGLKRILLGSVAERIIRHCDCSVLVLRCDIAAEANTGRVLGIPEHWLPREHILVPIDFSESSPEALATACEITDDPTQIHAMCVVELPEYARVIRDELVTISDVRNHHRKALERYLSEHGHATIQSHVEDGDPGMAIVKYAEKIRADLIVIPSHGRHGLRRMLLGSTTERVIRHSTAPVLVLRRHDAE